MRSAPNAPLRPDLQLVRTMAPVCLRATFHSVLLCCALIGEAPTAGGQNPAQLAHMRYDADPQHSMVGFTIRILGAVKVHGRFRDYSSTIIYDPSHPERASVTAVIQTASIDTDMEFRDKHLRSPDFFDTARYPTIVFQSDRVERATDGYRAIGRFTMHGVTRTIALPIKAVLAPETRGATGTVTVAFEATARVSRKDYGIAGTNKFNPDFDPAISALSDSVDVNLDILANRPGYLTWRFGGQTPPSIADTVGRVLTSHGANEAVRLYRSLHAEKPTAFDFGAAQLDALGQQLLERDRVPDALAILALNEEVYPQVNGVAQSLGDAYAWAGDSGRAVDAYRRALQVDSTNTAAIEMLRHLAPAADRR
jgi:polyisoprenoid-binding protein YceI